MSPSSLQRCQGGDGAPWGAPSVQPWVAEAPAVLDACSPPPELGRGKQTYQVCPLLQRDTRKAGLADFGSLFSWHSSLGRGAFVTFFGAAPELQIFPVRMTVAELPFVATEPTARFCVRKDPELNPVNKIVIMFRSAGRTSERAWLKLPANRYLVYASPTAPGDCAAPDETAPDETAPAGAGLDEAAAAAQPAEAVSRTVAMRARAPVHRGERRRTGRGWWGRCMLTTSNRIRTRCGGAPGSSSRLTWCHSKWSSSCRCGSRRRARCA